MLFRGYDNQRDFDAAVRIWKECGWLPSSPDEETDLAAMRAALSDGRQMVAEVNDEAECLVCTRPGTLRYQDRDLPLGVVTGVTTSRVARRQGLAGRLTAQAIAADVADGAAVEALGMFEQGFYDKLGFGNGSYVYLMDFDPSQLRVPGDVRPRPPRRLTVDDVPAMHRNRLNRLRAHGACSFTHESFTRADAIWRKSGFGLGYFDNDDGSLSHHFWATVQDDHEHGPYRIAWLCYQTSEQLIELLALIHALGDQVHLVRMQEPPGVQLQDLIQHPIRARGVRESGRFAHRQAMLAWWQMRINDLPRCLAVVSVPGRTLRFNAIVSDPIDRLLKDSESSWHGAAGSWLITIGEHSSAAPGDDPSLPTLHCSINALTRMWLGVRSPSGLAVTDDLTATDELLQQLDRALAVLPRPTTDWDF